MTVGKLILALWIVFYSYWAISAIGVKKAGSRKAVARECLSANPACDDCDFALSDAPPACPGCGALARFRCRRHWRLPLYCGAGVCSLGEAAFGQELGHADVAQRGA